MYRRSVYQQSAAAPEDGGGGAAGAIADSNPNSVDPSGSGSPLDAIPTTFGDLAPELSGVVREAKWRTPGDAVKSYHDLLSLKGAPADRLLKLPASPDSDESKAFLAQHMGVPGDATGYDLSSVTVPDGATDLRDALPEAFHAARVPADAAPALAEALITAEVAKRTASEQEKDAKFAEAKAAQNDKWGREAPQNWANVQKGYDLLGLPDAVADRIALEGGNGVEAFFDRLADIGRRMGEPTDHGALSNGNGGNGYVSPEQAQARIDELVVSGADPMDPKVRNEMDRMARIARPGRVSI